MREDEEKRDRDPVGVNTLTTGVSTVAIGVNSPTTGVKTEINVAIPTNF